MIAQAPASETIPARRRRPGTARRRNVVVVELLLTTGAYLLAYKLLINPMRHLEVNAIAGIFGIFGSRGVTVASRHALFISPSHKTPIIATLTPSCSSLMGILALGALAMAVLRRRRLNTLFGYIAAAILLWIANTLRMAASAYAGLAFGSGALILFHNWVGTLWNFAATLLGFLLLLYLTLPTLERAEQDRQGRHSAHRPESWARVGLGYRVPMLERTGPTRRHRTGWLVRHLIPGPERRRMAAHREEGRVDYRVGFLDVDQRKAAIARLAADGLEAHGATLLALARYEEDPTVLDALEKAIDEHLPQLAHSAEKPVDAMLAFWSRGWHGARDPVTSPPPIPEKTWRVLISWHGHRRRERDLRVLDEIRSRPSGEGLVEVVGDGLEYNRFPLLALAATATDATLLRVLSREIASRQWEPTASDAVTALRLFARGWLSVPVEHAQHERSADPTEQRVAQSNGAAGDTIGHRRIAVTGVGGPAGFSVCRALQMAGHEVFGLDPDPLAAGFRLNGLRPIVGPRADDEHFRERIPELVSERHFEVLISTVAEELPKLIAIAPELATLGCATWFPPLAAVEICLDKARFAATMQDYGIPHPPTATSLRAARHVPAPFVVKPRRGRGSRGVVFIDDRRHMRRALRSEPDLLVQSRLKGEEWTADVLVDRNGQLVACVPRWRLEVRGGVSVKGVTFDSQDVTRVCAEALAAVGLTGVANIQGVLDPSGHAAVIEINPRFSGGLPLSLAAGSDLVGTYLAAVLYPERLITPLLFRPGTTMVRHFEEMFEGAATSAEGGSNATPTTPSTSRPGPG
ncbi:MAG: ATP-grasp domain-containing protein [Acidimicrobiaceae bacterium]|nr:ATP-grasp domain-containing protein [Acidimicrobiaceae bacterium]